MDWQHICDDPALQNLAFKIETNEYGNIVMSPTRFMHGYYQAEIASLLKTHRPDGVVSTETAIQTLKGTKVADVAWCTKDRFMQVKDDYDTHIAPEICVEVLSPGNHRAEMDEKMRLYFNAGAKEVWFCDADGHVTCYLPAADRFTSRSELVPGFPVKLG